MSNGFMTPEMVNVAERRLASAIFHIDDVHMTEKPTVDIEDIDVVLAELIELRHRLAATYYHLERAAGYCRL
jgi:hypothetical protein